MYKQIPAVLTGVLSGFTLAGCATIFNSDPQSIEAKASRGDTGIAVEIVSPSGTYTDELPAHINAQSANDGVTIRVVDDQYRHSTSVVGKNVTPSYFVNILFWPGFIVDWATGRMWKYDKTVFVNAEKNN